MKLRWATTTAVSSFIALLAWPAAAAFDPGVYETMAGATVEERGDAVPNGSRIVPLFAMVTFNFSAAEPALSALITNAVVEGGNAFPLQVRSSFGGQLPESTYQFRGDYLQDLYPSGTQYLFDWRFSALPNGQILWNGAMFWAGGHLWQVTVSNLLLQRVPRLSIARVGPTTARITWSTNFAAHVLQHASSLPASEWTTVTNAVTTVGDGFSVTVDTRAAKGFFRLRGP